ncbi:unnamed protein product [Caenorhabditis angaria]|uniref:Uncharacterized protein n=1 Tax=Caenorhabditis angaria TaxID=860376 RepID=A0A9P1MWK6_9PELO|nr:unnamed protein product [Caenorhabditis angaria]
MNVTNDQLLKFSHSELLDYTIRLRNEIINQNGYIYPFQTSWFDLPLEMREMVIVEMDLKTRCNFSECAKSCEEEVMKSGPKITTISIENEIEIFTFDVSDDFGKSVYFDFEKLEKFNKNLTIVSYGIGFDPTSLTTIVGRQQEIRAKYLNYLFKKYNDSIVRCRILDFNESTTLVGIKLDYLTNLDNFEFRIWPQSLESIYEADIITENKLCQIKTVTLHIRQDDAYKFAFSFKGNRANMEFEENFDSSLFYQFLIRVKNEGKKEKPLITFWYDGRIDNSILNREELGVMNTWEKINSNGTISKGFEFETTTSQKIRVTCNTYKIDVKF